MFAAPCLFSSVVSCGRRRSNDPGGFGVPGVHEKIAASEECLDTKIIELVWSQRRDEDFVRAQGLLMICFEGLPVGDHDIIEHNIERGMVVPHQNVAVVHRGRIHVGMKVKDGVQNLSGLRDRLIIRLASVDNHTGAVREDDKVLCPVGVVNEPLDDAILRDDDRRFPFRYRRKIRFVAIAEEFRK